MQQTPQFLDPRHIQVIVSLPDVAGAEVAATSAPDKTIALMYCIVSYLSTIPLSLLDKDKLGWNVTSS